MGYSKAIYDTAEKKMEMRRDQAEKSCERLKAAFFKKQPKAEEIERSLADTSITAAKAVLRGGNVRKHLEMLKNANQSLQKELNFLLAKEGLTAADLEPKYSCKKCSDTGYLDGRMCSCMKQLLKEEAYRELNDESPLQLSSFETFSLRYYPSENFSGKSFSPQKLMEKNYQRCKQYAETFSPDSTSLLMTGGTGLGKTHLSLAIAKAVIDRGFGVVYGSASTLFSRMEKEHFSNQEEVTLQSLLNCDLLILDDLGTEFRTAFTVAALYNLVNSRQLSKKPMIISTNLSLKEMANNYTERFSSRIGSYILLPFFGKDIRQIKRFEKSEN
ncbi:AAA domain-containing protein [Ruminococcaceae bacterium BL-4]|nr:AAA domain-containing protein [Ruminococcaceae bacterium BL-4]